MMNGEVVSRWKTGRPVADYDLVTGEPQGLTIISATVKVTYSVGFMINWNK